MMSTATRTTRTQGDHKENARRVGGDYEETSRRPCFPERSRRQNAFPHALVHFGTTALTPPPLDWLRFKMLEANKAIYHWTMWILQ